METKWRSVVLPIETDNRLSVRGLINEKYVRVQFGRNDFFIPANTFKRAFFDLENDSMKVGDRKNGDPVSFQRVEDSDGDKMVRFTVRTNSGDIKHVSLPHYVMAEVVERIDQTKALLHSYQGVEETSSSDEENAHVAESDVTEAVASATL
ncbi:hypothetical protein ACFLZO_01155 [Patescibacteria group bacterium]